MAYAACSLSAPAWTSLDILPFRAANRSGRANHELGSLLPRCARLGRGDDNLLRAQNADFFLATSRAIRVFRQSQSNEQRARAGRNHDLCVRVEAAPGASPQLVVVALQPGLALLGANH